MREPRPRQRLPEGGLEIYEKQKAGLWKPGSELIVAYPVGWKNPRGHTQTQEEILRWGYTVFVQPHFDPMLYFWPVDGFHLVAHVESLDSDHTLRLVRASLRDGAQMVVTSMRSALVSQTRFYEQESGWKKPACEFEYVVPPPKKRSQYELTLDATREMR